MPNTTDTTYLKTSIMELDRGKRKSKTKNEDRLSSLPDHILVDILSYLPLKSAIITSALSSRWRHLWTQITSIWIDDEFFPGDLDALAVANGLFPQLTSQLIRNFKFYFRYCPVSDKNRDFSVMDSWFRFLCGRNVEEIHVFCKDSAVKRLLTSPPPCIFQTQSLVVLELGEQFGCKLPEDGEFNLPNLKKLRIRLSACNCLLLSKLIKSCPVLEYLHLDFDLVPTNESLNVEISSHNLKRLIIWSWPHKRDNLESPKVIIDAPKLTKFGAFGINSLRCYFGANTFQMLELGILLGYCSLILDHVPSKVFRNLTELRFEVSCSTRCQKLIALLQFCPVLRVLLLLSRSYNKVETKWIPPDSTSALVLTQLKRIHIRINTNRLKKHEHWLNLVKYLLSSAPVLEGLAVDCRLKETCEGSDRCEELLVCKELYECPRSSLCREIKFHGKHLKVSGDDKEVSGCDGCFLTLNSLFG